MKPWLPDPCSATSHIKDRYKRSRNSPWSRRDNYVRMEARGRDTCGICALFCNATIVWTYQVEFQPLDWIWKLKSLFVGQSGRTIHGYQQKRCISARQEHSPRILSENVNFDWKSAFITSSPCLVSKNSTSNTASPVDMDPETVSDVSNTISMLPRAAEFTKASKISRDTPLVKYRTSRHSIAWLDCWQRLCSHDQRPIIAYAGSA